MISYVFGRRYQNHLIPSNLDDEGAGLYPRPFLIDIALAIRTTSSAVESKKAFLTVDKYQPYDIGKFPNRTKNAILIAVEQIM